MSLPQPPDDAPAPADVEPLPRRLDPRHPRRRRVVTTALWSSRVFSAAVAVALLIACGYGFVTLNGLNSGLHRLKLAVGPQQSSSAPVRNVAGAATTSSVSGPVVNGQDQNILVVGNDDRSDMTDQEVRELRVGRDGGSLNTDTMLIVHAPADGSSATIISLPRDSYVAIPGYGMDRLNSAYSDGYYNSNGSSDAKRAAGANLLIKTVENLSGLTIDHFVQVGLLGFYRISNAIGGVPVNLCNAINGHPYTNLVLSKGGHKLRGVQALEFVRQRHGLPGGDLDRVARQRYFITAAFRTIASANVLLSPGKLSALVKAVDQSVYVDSSFDILKFAAQISSLSANDIVGETIPFVQFHTISGLGSVNIVDPNAVQKFVADLIDGTDAAFARAALVAPSSVTVRVVNGGAEAGTAATDVATLKRAGFLASRGATLPSSLAKTTIEYADGMASQAKTLARYLPGAALDRTHSVNAVTLVLGTDGKAAQSTPVHHAKPKSADSGCVN